MRTLFQQRPLREQTLILAVAIVSLAWVGSALAKQTARSFGQWRAIRAEQQRQDGLVARREAIFDHIARSAHALDPARTLDAAQSFAELSAIAADLPVEIGSPQTTRTGQFAVHSIPLTVRRVSFRQLLPFYERLMARAPYLRVEQCVISSARTEAALVNASFVVQSIFLPRLGAGLPDADTPKAVSPPPGPRE